MKILVIGAGAMGTLFGTALVKAGHDVTFLDKWGPLIYAIQQDSHAILKTETSTEKVPVKIFFSDEAPQTDVDLIIVFVKSSFTDEAISTVSTRGLISEKTVIITCQGGFENPDIIAKHMSDPSLLLSGCTHSFCKSCGPMKIEKFGIQKTVVWPYKLPPNQTPSQRVHDVISQLSSLQVELTPTAVTERWSTLLTYPTCAALSAVTGLDYGHVANTPQGKELLTNLAKEVALVAKLEGIDPTLFSEEVAIQKTLEFAEQNQDSPGTMLLDVRGERVTEIDATSGALLRKAAKQGVELPFTRTVWSLLKIKEQNYGNEY